jgi:hypothetical protein
MALAQTNGAGQRFPLRGRLMQYKKTAADFTLLKFGRAPDTSLCADLDDTRDAPETIEKICDDAGSKSLRFLKDFDTDSQKKSHYNSRYIVAHNPGRTSG